MSKMPVLDTCTEVASLLKLPGGGRFKLPTLTNYIVFFLIKVKRTTRPPMLRLRRVVLELIKRELYQRATGCAGYFQEFQKRIQERFSL
jgi:hypothetical protein